MDKETVKGKLLSSFIDVDDAFHVRAMEGLETTLRRIEESGKKFPFDYTLTNFHRFLRETTTALNALEQSSGNRIIDAGSGNCFVAMTLAHLGYDVSAVDREDYTQTDMMEARAIAADTFGVKILTANFADEQVAQVGSGEFDVATNFDVIEHIPGSPRRMLEEFFRWLKSGGVVAISTPNVAMWYIRARFALGRSPHSPIAHWYEASQPYDGHYREYTLDELIWMTEQSGFHISSARYCDEHNKPFWTWRNGHLEMKSVSEFVKMRPKRNLARMVYWAGGRVAPSMRDTIEVIGKKP